MVSNWASIPSLRRSLLVAIGVIAVAAMLVAVGLSITLGVVAPTASPDALITMRDSALVAGGVDVVALGLFSAAA